MTTAFLIYLIGTTVIMVAACVMSAYNERGWKLNVPVFLCAAILLFTAWVPLRIANIRNNAWHKSYTKCIKEHKTICIEVNGRFYPAYPQIKKMAL